MASFKEVFSTTWKVVLSLVIVSAIICVAYFLLSIPSHVSEPNAATATARSSQYDASDYHTRMPKSVWDKRVAWAINQHCYFAGMSSADAMHALGQPSKAEDHSLTFDWRTKDCARYEGDTCAEYKTEHKIIFLENGYVSSLTANGEECYTLSGANEYLGLHIPSEREMEAQKRLGEQRAANQQRLSALRTKCAPFENGSAEKVEQGKMGLPPRECREVLDWMRDAYLDTLYDLQEVKRLHPN